VLFRSTVNTMHVIKNVMDSAATVVAEIFLFLSRMSEACLVVHPKCNSHCYGILKVFGISPTIVPKYQI
jgi:hypothetical protein